MIRRENPNFVASIYAPNPKEVTYWIDLTEGPDGQIIKSYVNNTWVKVNQDKNDEQDVDITQLRQDVNTLATTKADKATTLSGYGITDAYTKTEVNDKVNAKVSTSTYNSDKATFATKSELNARVAANVAVSADATVEALEAKVNELINALIAAGLMASA